MTVAKSIWENMLLHDLIGFGFPDPPFVNGSSDRLSSFWWQRFPNFRFGEASGHLNGIVDRLITEFPERLPVFRV